MKLEIRYSGVAYKYVRKRGLQGEVREAVRKYALHLTRKGKLVDVTKLYGKWQGYYRMRLGDLRIILKPYIADGYVYIKRVGPRGDVYK